MGNENKQKILIVEDEIIVALDLKNTVESFGYSVTNIVCNDTKAIQSIKENKPDLVLMDINLKGSKKNGIEIASEIKKDFSLSVVYITAFCDEETINQAAITDPLGYIGKPFKRKDLQTTLYLAFYKLKTKEDKVDIKKELVDIGSGYFYNSEEKRVYFQELPIDLSPKQSALFDLLFSYRGQIVSFETIEYTLWEEDIVSDSSLRTLIYRLRTKLDHKLIETFVKRGCRLN